MINEKVINVINDAFDFLTDKGYEVVCVNLYGSQNYGLETPNSDIDLKAVVLPSLDDIINNVSPISTSVEFKGGLIDIKDIRLMLDNYKKQNTNYLETLFTVYNAISSKYEKEWLELRSMAEDIVRADIVKAAKAFYGMALQKQEALCHPYPSKVDLIDKWGYDAKQLCHIVRLHCMLDKFLEEPVVDYEDILNLCDDKVFKSVLIKIKTYEMNFKPDEAKRYAADYMRLMKEMVDKVVANADNYPVNTEVYDKMDKIKADIIKKYFKSRL